MEKKTFIHLCVLYVPVDINVISFDIMLAETVVSVQFYFTDVRECNGCHYERSNLHVLGHIVLILLKLIFKL